MHKILFFDDHLVTRRLNITRRFHQPQWIDDATYRDDITARGSGYNMVCPAPGGGYYLYTMTVLPGANKVLCLARSDDGIHFERVILERGVHHNCSHAIYPQDDEPHGSGQCVYYDANDPDPNRRYKLVDAIHSDPKYLCMAYSSDGLNWRRESSHIVLDRGSDTRLGMFRLRDGRYVVHLRAWTGDRRIFRVMSNDCEHWSPPQLVLHPGPLDPPMTQFYGLPAARYGDIFIGMLWNYYTPFASEDLLKGIGWTDTELVYSYDGLTWNRTHRPFMPRRQWGEYGGGSVYGCSMIERENDLLFYAVGNRNEHQSSASADSDPPTRATLVGSLRRDGFAGLTTEASGIGELYTDGLYLRDPRLTLNACARFGSIRVAVCDLSSRPLPGYDLDSAHPVSGDSLTLVPQWNEHADLAGAIDLASRLDPPGWVRLHIQLDRAELFALEVEVGLHVRSGAPGR